MSDEMRLLVYSFDSVGRAEAARSALEALDRQLGERNGHFAIVQKGEDGTISLREPRDLRQEIAGLAASVAGGVTWFIYTFVGLMGTPPAVLAEQAADDTAHRLVRDSGFPDQALFEIGEALGAGDAAVVALVPADERDALVAELERLGGRLWEHPLPPAVAAELRAGPARDA
ncbi:MAG TPA: DUF1269 domain-containing protein [Chloroflexaceae bacterium]|nr:DUF1269 domain-containing protein [Chloroflexaceae bacterium]